MIVREIGGDDKGSFRDFDKWYYGSWGCVGVGKRERRRMGSRVISMGLSFLVEYVYISMKDFITFGSSLYNLLTY